MKMKIALSMALVAVCGLVIACAGTTPKADDGFSQATTEYDAVLQGDRGTHSWKKISRAPSAITAMPSPSPSPTPAASGRSSQAP